MRFTIKKCINCNYRYCENDYSYCPRCSGEHNIPKNPRHKDGLNPTKIHIDETHPPSCLEAQQGGNHYQQGTIQPIEYIHANDLNFFEGNCIKYVTRARRKGSPVEDLKKALHYIQLQLKLEHDIDSKIGYSDAVSGD